MPNKSSRNFWGWLFARSWGIAGALLIVVASAYATKVWHELERIRSDNQQIQSDIKGIQEQIAKFDEIPMAYAETPKGLKLVPADHGVSKTDLEFLHRYRGPLLDEKTDVIGYKDGELTAALKEALTKGAGKDGHDLHSGRSRRQELIAYAVLRAHGSMPTYEVRSAVPNDLKHLVLGTSGNCSDYSVRLMMILESLGVKAATISSVTKNLGGHVVVDAYDPQEDTAYLLDANFNVMITLPDSRGYGFVENLMKMSKEERAAFAKNASVIAFPVYFRFVDPGHTAFSPAALTPEFINETRGDRESMWRRWMENDMDDLVGWWKRAPGHSPMTLREFSRVLSAIPDEFDISGDYAANLRKAAGLAAPKP